MSDAEGTHGGQEEVVNEGQEDAMPAVSGGTWSTPHRQIEAATQETAHVLTAVWVRFEGSEVCKVIVKDDADIDDLKKAAIEQEKYNIGPGNVELFKENEKPNVDKLVKSEMVDRWGTVEKPFLLHIKTVYTDELQSPSKRRKQNGLVKSAGQFDALKNNASDFWKIGSEYLEGTNLKLKGPFYCRPGVLNLFSFTETQVIKNSARGWILGPPGTGKSVSSFAFAMTLERKEWVISWLSLGNISSPSFVRFCGKDKSVGQLSEPSWLADLLDTLNVDKLEGKKHILFVDGIQQTDEHNKVVRICLSWAKHATTNRLVIISSMTARLKAKLEEDERNNVKEFKVYSWKLPEYISAVQDNGFFDSVKGVLDSAIDVTVAPKSREDLVTSKYHFAGGSCRFMFQYSTEVVISQLNRCVDSATDLQAYLENNVGDCSSEVINRLFSRYDGREYSVISDFAVRLIAAKRGPILVDLMIRTFRAKRNPSFHGAMLELWFFASLENGGLELYDDNTGQDVAWPECDCMEFNPNGTFVIPNYPIWLQPIRWDEGGYDAVYVDRENNYTRFVQVTRATTHPFKIQYFTALLSKFSEMFETKFLEICFVVPIDKVSTFKIYPVTGEGGLTQFGTNWTWGKEAESARILGTKIFSTN